MLKEKDIGGHQVGKMGLFSSLKNRFSRHKTEDVGDIKNRALAEDRFSRFSGPEYTEPLTREEISKEERPFSIRKTREELLAQPLMPTRRPVEMPKGLEPVTEEELTVEERRPIEFEKPEEKGNYEILDRLRFIENQLSAIKSQTETINERLKNLETRIGKRY